MSPNFTMQTETAKIIITDRSYKSWRIVHPEKFTSLSPEITVAVDIDPLKNKLFSKDTIRTDDGTVVYSPVRNHQQLAGVLMLASNKTFGRTENKKRLLFKCIPDDKYLPVFLVPYEIKMGFSKQMHNKYVVFRFDHWNDTHPRGTLAEVLGDVGNVDAFYEYQIHCRSLHISLTEFNAKTRDELARHTNDEYIAFIRDNPAFRITRAEKSGIFSIDPSGSMDFDDAFSVSPGGPRGGHRITVYIANVFVWLEMLGLWKSFSQRVSTIYLPDRRRPMLPTILSDSLCSLIAGQRRFVLAMTVEMDGVSGEIDWANAQFENQCICVSQNYVYESPELLKNPEYQTLFRITKQFDKSVEDSHDVVSTWMVQMNQVCGQKMLEHRTGIFRAMSFVNREYAAAVPEYVGENARRCIQTWNNTSGQYCLFADSVDYTHEVMGRHCYVHITSPIRRLVDLLNQMMFMRTFGLISGDWSPDANHFLDNWLDKMEYINASMRSIRKVQTDCDVLAKCTSSPEWLEQTHVGVVFDRVLKTDGMYSYMVYLEQTKLLSRVNTPEQWENYSKQQFRIYLFDDETKLCTKIRLHPCT